MNATTSTTLVLVRHGETEGNSSIRLYGATDIPLSDLGRRQILGAARRLEHERYDKVYVSPLSRSRESARLILDGRGPEPETVEGFIEIDFGTWEGWTFEEAAQRDPEHYALWQQRSADFAYPKGESRQGFRYRVAETTRRVFASPSGRLLAVLHKGVVKVILATLLGQDPEEYVNAPVELGSIHRLTYSDGVWSVVSANEVDHLGDTRIPE